MPQVIVLHWEKHTLRAVVAGRRVAHLEVDAVIDIPFEEDADAESIGNQLKIALAPHRPSRAKIVLAISRHLLSWQHLDLPPCPAEDLPDLVYMQAGFDTTRTGEAIGFDFLPLSGSDQSPHRVLAISLQAEELTLLRNICEAADLTPNRFVPLSLGWPAAAQRATRGDEQPIGIFVAPFAQEATIWATIDGQIVLFRQLFLPPAEDLEALSKALAAEFRRTLMAVSQEHPELTGASAWIVGKRPDEVSQLAELVDDKIEFAVQPMDFASDSALLSTKGSSEVSTSDTLPLAGLALDEAAGNAPPVDLLHPRKRPAPRAGKRTYALAGLVLLSLVTYGGWLGYGELNAPVELADTARAELALLSESEKKLEEDVEFVTAIHDWQDDSMNLLSELQKISSKMRPLPLESEEFNLEQDVVLRKLDIAGKLFSIDAALRTYPAVINLESRLRDGTGRVQRGQLEELGSPPDYDVWIFRASIDFSDEAVQEKESSKRDNK